MTSDTGAGADADADAGDPAFANISATEFKKVIGGCVVETRNLRVPEQILIRNRGNNTDYRNKEHNQNTAS